MKKLAVMILTGLLLFCAGCGQEAVLDSYENHIQEEQALLENHMMFLPGLSEDLCVLPEGTTFDTSLVKSYASALFNEDTKEVVYANQLYTKMYPASLTKCMTALLVMEHFKDLDQTVVVGEEAMYHLNSTATLAHLEVGGTYTIRQLLYALLLPSGNDAANVLAVAVSGSVDDFVELMNTSAQKMGLTGTHFTNPHGLHNSNHYTTPYEMYIIFHYCLEFSDFKEIISTRSYTCDYTSAAGTIATQAFNNTSSYALGYTQPPQGVQVAGGKTGYTATANRCLILYVKDAKGASYVSVIFGANGYDALYEQMNVLLGLIGS